MITKEKLFRLAKIHHKYHKATLDGMSPSIIQYTNKYNNRVFNRSKEYQLRWFERFKNPKEFLRPYLICIASDPTDEQAMYASSAMAIKFIEYEYAITNKIPVVVWNSSWDLERFPKEMKFIVVSNLTVDTPKEYIHQARSVLFDNVNSFRVVVVAGTNPKDFMDNYMRMQANAYFYFTKQIKKRVI